MEPNEHVMSITPLREYDYDQIKGSELKCIPLPRYIYAAGIKYNYICKMILFNGIIGMDLKKSKIDIKAVLYQTGPINADLVTIDRLIRGMRICGIVENGISVNIAAVEARNESDLEE
ncbi:hypothetical protein FOL47_006206 [Perkinsus chesapeaki]|uniref:Uncharacterized protein n=1 Tax=Perkinsus chesapeaki TaxID=330153 RepID=A0A7J6LT82_PERCH|nr:hypothetical protein FOL47_006206 [Perkinsus chesapeaki]